MSGDGDNDDDKQHEPSQKRLDDARKRGEIPKSTDLTTFAAYAGLLLIGTVAGAGLVQRFAHVATTLLDQPDRLAPVLFARASAPTGAMLLRISGTVAPFFLAPVCGVVLVLIGQRAVHFAPEKLALKWNRISPLANARQKFGRDGLFTFGKSLAKLVAVAICLAAFLALKSASIIDSLALAPGQSVALMLDLLLSFLCLLVLMTLVTGAFDYIWQWSSHKRRNRMSRKEMVDESRESDGDPHVKMQRRQRGQDIATNRMLQDVARADVVVVNPTHYAVALRWNRKGRGAPICVAKGVDEIAARIREKAAEAGVPLHSDPPTARAIHATVDIGRPILPEHYRAVAAAIRFAEALRNRGGKHAT